MTRIDRHEMFLEIADTVSKCSTCSRGSVGAVIVRDRRIVSIGYNGAPPGMDHCVHHEKEVLPNGCQQAIHAETNAIAWAARVGVPIEGCTMYCTHGPCLRCAQLMLVVGIVEVHYRLPYRTDDGKWLLADMGVQLVKH